jgi:hypothetical protein
VATGTEIFNCHCRYSASYDALFTWDRYNRVWVYSDHLGTRYWEMNKAGNWTNHWLHVKPIAMPAVIYEIVCRSRGSLEVRKLCAMPPQRSWGGG